MPRRQAKHPATIEAEYLAELRARVEDGPGMRAVAKAAGVSHQTVWRMLTQTTSAAPTVDGVERIRRALAKLEPAKEPAPPPAIMVRNRDHHAWLALAEHLTAEELARVAKDPSAVIAAAKRRGSKRT
jgi:hypothetical protein